MNMDSIEMVSMVSHIVESQIEAWKKEVKSGGVSCTSSGRRTSTTTSRNRGSTRANRTNRTNRTTRSTTTRTTRTRVSGQTVVVGGTAHNQTDANGNYIRQDNTGYTTAKEIIQVELMDTEEKRVLAKALKNQGYGSGTTELGKLEQAVHEWKSDNSTNNTFGSTLSENTYKKIVGGTQDSHSTRSRSRASSSGTTQTDGRSTKEDTTITADDSSGDTNSGRATIKAGNSFVKHTVQWEKNLQWYNQNAKKKREDTTFWIGEKLVLQIAYQCENPEKIQHKDIATYASLIDEEGKVVISTTLEEPEIKGEGLEQSGTLYSTVFSQILKNGEYTVVVTNQSGNTLASQSIIFDQSVSYFRLHQTRGI